MPIRNTQHAIRNTQGPQSANTQYAIRNTQYAGASKPQYAIRNTQYAIRRAPESPTAQYAIRNTQCAGHLNMACEWVARYAIRNTQYATCLKVGCVIRKTLSQYAARQYAAYTVFYTSHCRLSLLQGVESLRYDQTRYFQFTPFDSRQKPI